MTIDRIKGAIAFICDLEDCGDGIETGCKDFMEAKQHAKDEDWQFRNRDGVWKHFCCRAHEEMAWRGQRLTDKGFT